METRVIQFEEKHHKIILPSGAELEIPQRNDIIQQKLSELEKSRCSRSEYSHYTAVFEVLFGKDSLKVIAPSGRKENLDYLASVYTNSLALYNLEKTRLEQESMEKQVEALAPLTEKMEALTPIIGKIK